jgi:hypothetical protein
MSNFWNNRRIKKTRKKHRCECCGQIIPVGNSCEYSAGKFDGDFFFQYVCERCWNWVLDNRDRLDSSELSWDEVIEIMSDDFRENVCCNCDKWDKENRECELDLHFPKCEKEIGNDV